MTEKQGSASATQLRQELWAKYEDIAMHFNDLLMRLRGQSLAAIAALSTIVGVLANSEKANLNISWFVAELMFLAMTIFWVAVWCLDFLYYNRLLRGAVSALAKIEAETQSGAIHSDIYMSSHIEAEFNRPLMRKDIRAFRGVLLFYGIVFLTLVAGTALCTKRNLREPAKEERALNSTFLELPKAPVPYVKKEVIPADKILPLTEKQSPKP